MSRPELVLIAAVARNGVIGAGGGLPWHLPADLRRFKALTSGHPVVMGRRTFESIGKPLPQRTNIVVSTRTGFEAPRCAIAPDLPAALAMAGEAPGGETVFVIGGGTVYDQTIDAADRLEITHVDHDVDGDTWFPAIDPARWEVVAAESHPVDGDTPAFEYRTYRPR